LTDRDHSMAYAGAQAYFPGEQTSMGVTRHRQIPVFRGKNEPVPASKRLPIDVWRADPKSIATGLWAR
jgi:hypothetical protein